jgi:hypothetical protein
MAGPARNAAMGKIAPALDDQAKPQPSLGDRGRLGGLYCL